MSGIRPPHHSTTPPLLTVHLVPTVGVALEWLRATWPLNGLPWLFLGHGQTPVLAMCQVADALGVYGISFWVVALNTLAALFVIERFKARRLVPAAAVVASMLVPVLGYGLWRMSQTHALSPGPVVMVVQPNYLVPMVQSPIGIIAIVVVVLLAIGGSLWMLAVVRVRF